jgi:formate hydrogenlyase transcriptional activator
MTSSAVVPIQESIRSNVMSPSERRAFCAACGAEELNGIVGSSPLLQHTLRQARVVAPTDSTVLISGETGTGKELFARLIHDFSRRLGGPFVRVNCAAIPEGLLESELFGHERGAFTSACAQRVGRFEAAHRGTLFLDEIGDIPASLQPKLLRVLQDGEFERLGGARTIRADVRVVAATNKDLTRLVAEHAFRMDLFYRLNVFPINLPPLRDRREDIPTLVRYFTAKAASRMQRHIATISPEEIRALTDYYWPGNIRELQNVIERAVILAEDGVLRIPSFGPSPGLEGLHLVGDTLTEVERDHIVQVLDNTHWVVGGRDGAARRLGLPRTTLISKMKKLGISDRRQGPVGGEGSTSRPVSPDRQGIPHASFASLGRDIA